MSLIALSIATGVVFLSAWTQLFSGSSKFTPQACSNVESFLTSHVVGQELAINQLVDAVCVHLMQAEGGTPLVISMHGPPGVGKTFTHTLLARALYNKDPAAAAQCPGEDCTGAKVVYGLDFIQKDRAEQLDAVRDAILEHVRTNTDPLIVIEEYDKLDCASRAMVRQLIQHPEMANATFNRAILLLESNLGFSQIEEVLSQAGDRGNVSPEHVDRVLRDLVFGALQASGCESYEDSLRFTSLVDFFLPYLPLQRPQVLTLMERAMQNWAASLWHDKFTVLEWEPEIIAFLVDKVDFDGDYPLEGAKGVRSVATRHIARLIRHCPIAKPAFSQKDRLKLAPVLQLVVQDGKVVAQGPVVRTPAP